MSLGSISASTSYGSISPRPLFHSNEGSLSSSASEYTYTRNSSEELQGQYFTERQSLARSFLSAEDYIPLGSLTILSNATVKAGTIWTESMHAPIALPEAHPTFWFLRTLLHAEWIRVYTRVSHNHKNLMTIRVHVLPDDVGRRYLSRGDTKARKALVGLVLSLDRSRESWEGLVSTQSPLQSYDSISNEDDSLFYIFNTLASPSPDPSSITDRYAKDAVKFLLQGSTIVPGLKSKLYHYQQRSAAMMIKREVAPARTLDPRLEILEGPTGIEFFFDREGDRLLREKIEYDEARGGILAETMGYGKTLICLAVILSTKGHLPQVPPEYSLGLRPSRPRVGSLLQMAAATANRERIPWTPVFHNFSSEGDYFERCITALKENACRYLIPEALTRRSRRPSTVSKGQIINPCSATLVIVPSNLVVQWQNEIATHLEEDSLSVLVIDSLSQAIPSATDLMQYDIILIRKDRFECELQTHEGTTNRRKHTSTCKCPYDDHCNSSFTNPYYSPFRDLHFLRLIVDEGHNFVSSGSKGNAVHVLKSLHVDRRWIVSGTPSNGLLGVEVGMAANETSENSCSTDPKEKKTALNARREEVVLSQERKDLEKLGRIVVDFLALQPWVNQKVGDDPASWQKYILPSKNGQRKAKSLRSTLESLVVRHRIEDIEADLQLPPLQNRVVYLEPSFHDKLSLNLFTMVLTANAVTSERVDQDYIFHPSNRRQLDHLVSNLRQSGFYWTGFSAELIEETIKNSRSYLEKDTTTSIDEFECTLLEECIDIGLKALSSPSWKAFSDLHEIGLYVVDFPREAQDTWALQPVQSNCPALIGATQLRSAQQYISAHLSSSTLVQGLATAGVEAMEKAWTNAQSVSAKNTRDQVNMSKKSKIAHVEKNWVPLSSPTFSPQKPRAYLLGPDPAVAKSIKHEIHKTTNSIKPPSGLKSALKRPAFERPACASSDTALSKTKICGTTSVKLSYLLDRVVALHESEKILIFYEADHIAYYIAQALDLIDIPYLIYAKSLTLARRNTYMTTFNTTDNFHVMLMDLRSAAHGLHIACASRVYFVNPVWQPNVEAQAIKRAHRIGQIRSVYAETLVLKDTLEDQMLQRRKAMTSQEHQQAEKSLLDDSTMGAIIKSAAFVPFIDKEFEDVNGQIALLQHPLPVFSRIDAGAPRFDNPDAGLVLSKSSIIKNGQLLEKKRQGHFSPEPELVSAMIRTKPAKRRKSEDVMYQTSDGILMTVPKSGHAKVKKTARFDVDEQHSIDAPFSHAASSSEDS